MPNFEQIASNKIPDLNPERAKKVLLALRQEQLETTEEAFGSRAVIVGPGKHDDECVMYRLRGDELLSTTIQRKDNRDYPITLIDNLQARKKHLAIWKGEIAAKRSMSSHPVRTTVDEVAFAAEAMQIAEGILQQGGNEAFGDHTPEVLALHADQERQQRRFRYRNYPGLKQSEFPTYNMNTVDDLCSHIILAEGPKDADSYMRLIENTIDNRQVNNKPFAFLALGQPVENGRSKYVEYVDYPKEISSHIRAGIAEEGMACWQIPAWEDMQTLDELTDEDVTQLYDWLDDTNTQKVIHCSAGLGRSGTLMLAYVLTKKYGDDLANMDAQQLGKAAAETLQAMRARRPGLVQQPEQLQMAIQLARRFVNLRPAAEQTQRDDARFSQYPPDNMLRASAQQEIMKQDMQQHLHTLYTILSKVPNSDEMGDLVPQARKEQVNNIAQCLHWLENPESMPAQSERVFSEENVPHLQLSTEDRQAFLRAQRAIVRQLQQGVRQPILLSVEEIAGNSPDATLRADIQQSLASAEYEKEQVPRLRSF